MVSFSQLQGDPSKSAYHWNCRTLRFLFIGSPVGIWLIFIRNSIPF